MTSGEAAHRDRGAAAVVIGARRPRRGPARPGRTVMSVIGHRRGGPPAGTEPFHGRPGSRRPLRRPSSRCSWQRCAASTGCSPAIMPGCSPGTAPSGEARPYVPSDDPRHIDWAVTARTSDPHVRDDRRPRLELWLVLDTSSSHAFRNWPVDQARAGVDGEAFALLASRGGNRIGAVASEQGWTIDPRPSRPCPRPPR